MDFRRSIVWVVFIVSGLFLLDGWQRHQGQAGLLGTTARPVAQAVAGVSPTVNGGDSVPVAPATANIGTVDHILANTVLPIAPITPVAMATLKIANEVLAIEVSHAGGNIVRAELLQHKEDHDLSKNIVLLNNDAQKYLAQTGLSGKIGEKDLPNHTANTLFTVVSQSHTQLVLQAVVDGVTLIKTIALSPNSYSIQVKHQVINASATAIAPSLYLQLVHHGIPPKTTGSRFTQPISTFTGAAVYTEDSKYQKITFEDIDKQKAKYNPSVKDKEPSWIAMVQHYFVSAWVAKDNQPRTFNVMPFTSAQGERLYRVTSMQSLGNIAAGASLVHEATLYVGPQDQTALEQLATGLDLVVDYGVFTIIAKPMFALLKLWHDLTGNWGWAIILLTMSIKALLYMPMAMSYRSMAKMKNMGPKIKALQERYADDKLKLNSETMALYRTEKINPLGGCLPILFTIPVFMSLYWVLLSSVEMRHAPWLGWITNLAVADPLYILPVLLMVTMFVQFKMNPAPPDPMQAKMMMVVQAVFAVMFAFFPAGLNIYYLVNNVLSIVQQWYITRMLEKEGLQAPKTKKPSPLKPPKPPKIKPNKAND